jgi:hypothetical protein
MLITDKIYSGYIYTRPNGYICTRCNQRVQMYPAQRVQLYPAQDLQFRYLKIIFLKYNQCDCVLYSKISV